MNTMEPGAGGKGRTNGKRWRRGRVLLLVCMVIAAGVLGGASSAVAAPAGPDGASPSVEGTAAPKEVRYLCERKSDGERDGVLRYAKGPGRCDAREEKPLRVSADPRRRASLST